MFQTVWEYILSNELIIILIFLAGLGLGIYGTVKFIKNRMKLVVNFNRFRLDPKQQDIKEKMTRKELEVFHGDDSTGEILSKEQIEESKNPNLLQLIKDHPDTWNFQQRKNTDGSYEITPISDESSPPEFDATISYKFVFRTPKWFSPIESRHGIGVAMWKSFAQFDRNQQLQEENEKLLAQLNRKDKDIINFLLEGL